MTSSIWLQPYTSAQGKQRVLELFEQSFGADPQDKFNPDTDSPADDVTPGVWSAPGRVNLIGEHTDYNGGLAMPIALPHRTYIALRPRSDTQIRLRSAQTPDLWEGDLDTIAPGETTGWGTYVAGVAWALREAGYPVGGFDAAIDSRVPFGASLSSSAALEAAVAVALSDAFGLGLTETEAGRQILARVCQRAENEIAGAPTGGLDQAIALLAQPGHALRLDFNEKTPNPPEQVPFDLHQAGLTLLVIDSRAPHQLVDGQYGARRESCEEAADVLGVDSLSDVSVADWPAAEEKLTAADTAEGRRGVLTKRARHVVHEIDRTNQFADVLRTGLGTVGVPNETRVRAAGDLMNASHDSLRDDYHVTVPQTDLAVSVSRAQGAYGARMTGGGFGGSTIALIKAGDEERVANAVTEAFAKANFDPPAFLVATPSDGAHRE